MNNIDAILRNIVMLIAIVAIAYFINSFGKQYLTNKAVDGCMSASQTELQNTDNSRWTGPNETWYVRCMQEKGIDK